MGHERTCLHATCKKFSAARCDVPWSSRSLCRVAPDSPTQPIAATLSPRPPRRSPAAPRFTPYSLDPVTTGGKPRLKLALRTHPLVGSWSLPCLSKSSHAPAATSATASPAAAQSGFTFLSDTQRQLRHCPYAKGSFAAQFSSIVLKTSFP